MSKAAHQSIASNALLDENSLFLLISRPRFHTRLTLLHLSFNPSKTPPKSV
jgi:hypothetical protein